MLQRVGHGEELEIIGVRPQVAKRFRKSDDWVDLWTYARNIVKIDVVQKKMAQHIVNAEVLDTMTNYSLWKSVLDNEESLGKLNPGGSLNILIDALFHMNESKETCANYTTWRQLATECNISLDSELQRDLDTCVSNVYQDYPLFKLLVDMRVDQHYSSDTFNGDDLQTISQYIHLAEFEKFGG